MSVIQECQAKIAEYEAELAKPRVPKASRQILEQRIRERREMIKKAEKEAGKS
jgi:hypothetical protein